MSARSPERKSLKLGDDTEDVWCNRNSNRLLVSRREVKNAGNAFQQGNGACCTYEQEMGYAVHIADGEKQKAKQSFGTLEDKLSLLHNRLVQISCSQTQRPSRQLDVVFHFYIDTSNSGELNILDIWNSATS